MTDAYFADISSNNGAQFDAGAYASAGHRTVALKATEDAGYVNPYYAGWVESAHAHGLKVIHYMFARPENGNPAGQAQHFWETVKAHFHRPGDWLAIDLETSSPSEGRAWLPECDARLRSLSGGHPWLYSYLSYLLQGGITISSGLIWCAAWGFNRPGGSTWKLPNGQTLIAWQYTDGRVTGPGPESFAGIPGNCDGSLLNPSLVHQIKKSTPKEHKHKVTRYKRRCKC